MRKILSLILILGIITGLSSLRILGATETINYDLEFINNKKWDINNGNYVTDTNYMATTRHRIVENDINLNNLNFHHILFWSDNLYLGYYNTTAGGYENSKYLGDTGVNVTVPANATWFSLTAYKLSPNELPQTIFNGDSLEDVFTVDYKTTPISTLNNQSLNTVFFTNNIYVSRTYFGGANGKITFQNNNIVTWEKITTTLNYWYITDNVPNHTTSKYYISIVVENYFNDYQWRFDTQGTLPLFAGVNAVLGIQTISGIQTTNINDYGLYPQFSPGFQRNATYFKTLTILLDMNLLGISSLTKSNMDYWLTQYQSTAINLQAFNEYNSVTLTQTQLDEYLATYTANQVWADGISMLLFYSMEASYDREEVIPDERNFLERLSDWFDDFGLGAFPKIVISLVVFIAVAVIMYLFKVSMLGILIIEFVFFVMLVVFGFFPVWLVIVVAIVLLFFIIMALVGGL